MFCDLFLYGEQSFYMQSSRGGMQYRYVDR